MYFRSLFVCTVLILLVHTVKVESNQIKKLNRGIDFLREKFSTLDENVFDMQNEIEAIWRYINETNVNPGSFTTSKGIKTEFDKTQDILRDNDIEKLIRKMEEKNNLIFKSFSEEKMALRDGMIELESDILNFKNQQAHELSILRNTLYNRTVEMNATLKDSLDEMKDALTLNNDVFQQELITDFTAMNISISENLDGLQDSLIKWKNDSMMALEKRVQDMEIRQTDALKSITYKVNQSLSNLESKSENFQQKALAAQDLAKTKATELELTTKTIHTLQDKTKNLLKSLQFLQNAHCVSTKGTVLGNKCFKLSETTATWYNAQDECSVMGGHLAEVVSEDIRTKLAEMDISRFWVGGSDIKHEGQWMWEHSETKINDQFWNSGEPNDHKSNEDCAEFYGAGHDLAGKLNDYPCGRKIHYVCEITFNF